MAHPMTALALAVCFVAGAHGPATAEGRSHRLQGMFCNTEQQIDSALALVGKGSTPRTAVALVNGGDTLCTYVDLLTYVVERPVAIGGRVSLAKYRGLLTGVVVGGRLRDVSPPVEVFFVTPERIADAAVERQT